MFFCELWFLVYLLVYLFHYKDREVFFFLICALRIVIFGREFSLSTFTFLFTLLLRRKDALDLCVLNCVYHEFVS